MTPELALEQRAHRLRGERLRAVFYQRGRELEGGMDSVGHLVFLDFESGTRVAIGCTDELRYKHGFGISVRPQRVIDTAFGEAVDMGDRPRWKALFGRSVTSTSIHWDGIKERLRPTLAIGVAIHADHLSRLDYPQTLELDLEGQSVFFAAARPSGKGAVPFVNELLVFFSAETREALGL